ncbi:hypothetical protein [Yeosuana marina]|uniref:hypothetical protein n=1 Tax=Yeosuana marina TaxID=1565536 RepID=UPI0030EECAA2
MLTFIRCGWYTMPVLSTLIDIHSIFADQNDLIIKKYTVDGVHPSEAGYEVWTNYIIDYVN